MAAECRVQNAECRRGSQVPPVRGGGPERRKPREGGQGISGRLKELAVVHWEASGGRCVYVVCVCWPLGGWVNLKHRAVGSDSANLREQRNSQTAQQERRSCQ